MQINMLTKISGLGIFYFRYCSNQGEVGTIVLNVSSLQVGVLSQNYDDDLDVGVSLSLLFILKLVCKSKKVLLPYYTKNCILNHVKDILASRNLWKLFISCFETNYLTSETQWEIRRNCLFQNPVTNTLCPPHLVPTLCT